MNGPQRESPRAPPPRPRDDPVALDPVRVDVEIEALLLIHEGVEVDRHQIVGLSAVSVYPVRAHDRGVLVVHVEPEVDLVRIVGDVDVGGLGRRRPVERRQLRDLRGGPPHFVVQSAIDHRRGAGPARAYSWSTRERAEIDRVRGGLRRCPSVTGYLCVEGPGDRSDKREIEQKHKTGGPQRGSSAWVRTSGFRHSIASPQVDLVSPGRQTHGHPDEQPDVERDVQREGRSIVTTEAHPVKWPSAGVILCEPSQAIRSQRKNCSVGPLVKLAGRSITSRRPKFTRQPRDTICSRTGGPTRRKFMDPSHSRWPGLEHDQSSPK